MWEINPFFRSKIRTSNNGIAIPRLSDLVDMNLGPIGTNMSFKPFGESYVKTEKNHILVRNPEMSSFRVHPRKFSEDNILTMNTLQKLRRPSCDDNLTEFEVFSKRTKRN